MTGRVTGLPEGSPRSEPRRYGLAAALLCLFFALGAPFGDAAFGGGSRVYKTLTGRPALEDPVPCQPEALLLEARLGFLLHAITYRLPAGSSRGVVLAHDWVRTWSACWEDLPDSLCAAGFEVLIPDLRGPVQSHMPEMPQPFATDFASLEWFDAGALLSAFGDSVESIALVCVGWAGWVAPCLVHQDPRVRAVAWIGPRGDLDKVDEWDLPRDQFVRLLLVGSQEEVESSALAGDLFSRFNDIAELRLFSRGDGGCRFLAQDRVRIGLREWLDAELGVGAAPPRPR